MLLEKKQLEERRKEGLDDLPRAGPPKLDLPR